MKNKNKVNVCTHCGNSQQTNSTKEFITCSSCQRKTVNKTLLKTLVHLLPQDINDLIKTGECDLSEDYINDTVEAKYHDAYESETITINRTFETGVKAASDEQWKTAYYNVTIERYNVDDEIMNTSALVQHDNLSDEQRKMNKKRWDKHVINTADHLNDVIQTYGKMSRKDFKILGTKARIEKSVHEYSCHVNISHTHYFKGYTLEVTTTSLEDLNNLLNARDFLFSLYAVMRTHIEGILETTK